MASGVDGVGGRTWRAKQKCCSGYRQDGQGLLGRRHEAQNSLLENCATLHCACVSRALAHHSSLCACVLARLPFLQLD